MKVVSFFAGCGGLDLGFERAGYKVLWANEIETSVHATYEKNHPSTILCKEDINVVNPQDVPDCDGFIGGPPCQSWSVAGKQQGLDDKRGQLFLTYIGMIRAKMPKFFVIENVKGLLDEKFKDVFENFLAELDEIGYDVKYRLLDAVDYEVPQNRERVFLIGFRHDLGIDYHFPQPSSNKPLTLKDAIGDITATPIPCEENEVMTDSDSYYSGKFGPHYYRGNRRRNWDKPSFTIHATGYNIPLHPSSPSMIYNAHEDWSFIKGKYREYRRLTVRECARIQTFPDNFEIDCPNIIDTYKMIGNAVPVRMAEILATSIKEAIEKATSERKQQRGDIKPEDRVLVGFYKGYPHWKIITHQGFYYVRADGRKGAMSIEDLMPLPRLLLLHSNDRMQLYEMTDIEPRYYGKDYIQRLGFEPSGETYIGVGFDASSKYKLKEVAIDKDNIKLKERFAPYVTTFGELINKK